VQRKEIVTLFPFYLKLNQTSTALSPFQSLRIDTLQINVGKRCNLMCRHCHHEAGPHRFESMTKSTLEACLAVAGEHSISTIDVTGGSPEMNPHLPWFLASATRLGKRLMVRSNLQILLEKEYRHFIDIYAAYRVELIGSLPCYTPETCDGQRGKGGFERIIAAMKLLNDRGYGTEKSGLILDLVHNPAGPFLPGPQAGLEKEYKTRLTNRYGVSFNHLYCLTNNPIGRFGQCLAETGNYARYMEMLERAFNSRAAQNVMCRTALSVGWDGALYDCDFNQALGVGVDHGAPNHIGRFDMQALQERQIVVGDHCYACTAGQGSSCHGAVTVRPVAAGSMEIP
jgi:radical SAM/Cys-rich protein